MKDFWIDPFTEATYTYIDLLSELNTREKCMKYVITSNTFELWLHVLLALIHNVRIELLDCEFTNQEITNIGISKTDLLENYEFKPPGISSFNKLFHRVKEFANNSNIVIYTSGTTGKPKKVALNLDLLARNVKTGDEYKDHVWAFAYNPTHFAGLQVFFQVLFNQNTMVDIFNVNSTKISDLLSGYKITHLSATPTFYRKLLLSLKNSFPTVKRLTLGGERFDPSLEKELLMRFPNAKVKNIYASTEAGTLFSSDGEVFTISENISKDIKISDSGELLISHKLLGEFDQNDDKSAWYHSGDLVEMISANSFKFLSRKTEMINVGGYKVNPHEVETEIKKVSGVRDALIKARSNKVTGNILIAEVQGSKEMSDDDLEHKILDRLKDKLQPYKIPRIINFVDQIELTRTGKKGRN